MRNNPWTAKEKAFIVERPHWTAQALADALGRGIAAVRMARKRWNATQPKPSLKVSLAEFRAAYGAGLSDALIALRLGVDAETARRWRKKLKLPANGWCEITRKAQARRAVRTNGRRMNR